MMRVSTGIRGQFIPEKKNTSSDVTLSGEFPLVENNLVMG
jgi:hypothetical protein